MTMSHLITQAYLFFHKWLSKTPCYGSTASCVFGVRELCARQMAGPNMAGPNIIFMTN